MIRRLLIGILFFMFLTPISWAENRVNNEDKNRPFLVATKVAPPFSMKSDEGTWYGISIDLWKIMAQRLGIEYSFKEYDLHGLLKAVETKEVDLGIAAISMTSEREKLMDFSHSYYKTGLGLVVRDIHEHSFSQALKKLTSFKILFMVSGSISVFDMKRFSSRVLALLLSFFGLTFIAG